MPTLPQRRFIKCLNAATPPFEQPAGSLPRLSNLQFTKVGGLINIPGSATLSRYNNIMTQLTARLLDITLYQPSGGPQDFYLSVLHDTARHPIPPSGLTATAQAGAGLPDGNYFYVVTGVDGIGGETTISNEANVVLGAGNNQVVLNWGVSGGPWQSFNVYRSTVAGAETLITNVGPNADTNIPPVTFTDTGSVAGATTPPLVNTAQQTDLMITSLPSFFTPGSVVITMPAPAKPLAFGWQLGQVPTSTPAAPPTGILTSPNGGVKGCVNALPQMVPFADKMLLLLGNGYRPKLYTVAAGALPITNSFVVSYPAWAATTAFATGSVIAAVAGGVNSVFKVTQGGTTAGVAPTWNNAAATGQTIADGTIIWTNQGPVVSPLPPRGAAHGIVYAGALWVLNTNPFTTTDLQDGPGVLKMSDINNPNSWNPLNVAFIGRDDGTEGTGLASFTIAEAGIAPTGSLVVFKDFSTYQVLGVFGAADFAIQQAQTDMGCIAPRSIQFLPGFGIVRLTHLGFAIFDGVRDRVISADIYPYIFGGEPDITTMSYRRSYFSKGAQSVTPPMYLCAVPLDDNSENLTRIFCYNMILKGWTIVDIPFPISCLKQIRMSDEGSMPITVAGDAQCAAVRRLFATPDTAWQDYPAQGTTTPINWSVRTPEVFSKSLADAVSVSALYVRGNNKPITLKAQLVMNNKSLPNLNMKIVVQNGTIFEALLQTHMLGKNVHADISGSGPVELYGFDWDVEPQPARPPVLM